MQVARLFGAKQVIAGVGGADKRSLALELGADAAVDYSQEHWPQHVLDLTGGRGVDLLLEMTCGTLLHQGLGALAAFGRAVIYGSADRVHRAPDRHHLLKSRKSFGKIVLRAWP